MSIPQVTLRTGTTIPQLGFGVFQVPNDETAAAVRTALEAGYTSIDTASIYRNEVGVGEALRDFGAARDDIFVTSKVWADSMGPGQVRASYEASLERLGLDTLDLFLIHWPSAKRGQYVGAWEQMLELRSAGLVREVGVSNFQVDHLDRLAAATGELPPINQVELHPALIQSELRTYHDRHQIATEAWSPLAQGQVLDAPAVTSIAAAHGVSAAQVVIRWHLQLGNVVIPKSVTPSRIAANLDVFGFELDAEQMSAVSALDSGTRTGAHPDLFNP